MTSVRQGLKNVSGNSPAIAQLQLTKSQELTSRSPTKMHLKKMFAPISPLIQEENKENFSQTNEPETSNAFIQTEVSVVGETPEITQADLESESETVNYWRNLHDESLRELEVEQNRTLELLNNLEESITELKDADEKLEILKEVLGDAGIEVPSLDDA